MMIPLGEGDLPLVLDFTYFDDACKSEYMGRFGQFGSER